MRLKTLLLLGLAFGACRNENSKPSAAAQQPEKYALIKKADWFLGDWGNQSASGNYAESWAKANDSTYQSRASFVVGKDTVFAETVDLVQRADTLQYIVSVPGQNEEKPVAFKMISATENKLVFANPTHDFPQKITYTKITNDSLVAEISGQQKGKPVTELFPMKRR
ncbi:DUF6265 domain-containing protein [Flavobacterium longum]|uniref:DUF6265 family protein n=1 Tax=Flavobacterium longum TaxID=1299340 RepID=UPI0039ECB228